MVLILFSLEIPCFLLMTFECVRKIKKLIVFIEVSSKPRNIICIYVTIRLFWGFLNLHYYSVPKARKFCFPHTLIRKLDIKRISYLHSQCLKQTQIFLT